eukprot:gb/GECH01003836.1/.p1 GENE.gb/GECH01003836.1/~~gb/GECH01003836.1/.p1  ORF type:complete len:251 (+),score=41.20 gb/GECH01003836.1/:1-753(+)
MKCKGWASKIFRRILNKKNPCNSTYPNPETTTHPNLESNDNKLKATKSCVKEKWSCIDQIKKQNEYYILVRDVTENKDAIDTKFLNLYSEQPDYRNTSCPSPPSNSKEKNNVLFKSHRKNSRKNASPKKNSHQNKVQRLQRVPQLNQDHLHVFKCLYNRHFDNGVPAVGLKRHLYRSGFRPGNNSQPIHFTFLLAVAKMICIRLFSKTQLSTGEFDFHSRAKHVIFELETRHKWESSWNKRGVTSLPIAD